jgi:hypothetical protein
MGSRRRRGLPEMPADRSRFRRMGRERDGEGDGPIRSRKERGGDGEEVEKPTGEYGDRGEGTLRRAN